MILYLVGGLEHGFYDFPYIGNSNPNWLIFIRGVETTNQIWYDMIWYSMIWYDMRIMEHHFLVLSVTFWLFLSSSDLWVFAWVGIISNRRMSHCLYIYIPWLLQFPYCISYKRISHWFPYININHYTTIDFHRYHTTILCEYIYIYIYIYIWMNDNDLTATSLE